MVDNTSAVGNDSRPWVVPQSIKWLSTITRERRITLDSESGGIPHLFGTSLSPHIGSAWQARHNNNNNKPLWWFSIHFCLHRWTFTYYILLYACILGDGFCMFQTTINNIYSQQSILGCSLLNGRACYMVLFSRAHHTSNEYSFICFCKHLYQHCAKSAHLRSRTTELVISH